MTTLRSHPFRLGKVGDPVEVLAHRVRVAGVVNAACIVPPIHQPSGKKNSPKFSCRIMHILVYEGGAMQLSTSLMDMSQHYIL